MREPIHLPTDLETRLRRIHREGAEGNIMSIDNSKARAAFDTWLRNFESKLELTEGDIGEFGDRMQMARDFEYWHDPSLRRYCSSLMTALEEGHLSVEELRPAEAN